MQTHPVAAELLENIVFAFTDEDHVPPDFMRICLQPHSSQLAAEHPVMARVVFRNACRVLMTWHLIDLAPGCVNINMLTQDILRDLLRESAEVVCNRLLDAIEPWETEMRRHTARLFDVPILQEMVAVGVSRHVYTQEASIKMTRNSLCSTSKYEQELDEMDDRRRELLDAETNLAIRLGPWILKNAAVTSENNDVTIDLDKYLCYKE